MDAFDALTSPRTYRGRCRSTPPARSWPAKPPTATARGSSAACCRFRKPLLEAVAHGAQDHYRPDARPSEAVLRSATTSWVATHFEKPGQQSGW